MFEKILTLIDANVVILYVWGDDNDPVVKYLKRKGVTVIDVRQNDIEARQSTTDYLITDNIYDYDLHPGTLSNYHWYRSLVNVLEDTK